MKKQLLVALSIAIFFLWSCGITTGSFKILPEGPINHQLIVLAKTSDGVRARGFAGATKKGTKVFISVGAVSAQTVSSDDGSFSLMLLNVDNSLTSAEITFNSDGKYYQSGYQIKDLNAILRDVAGEAFELGKEIDSIEFVGDHVAILSSDAALIRTFRLTKTWRINDEPDHAILLATTVNAPLMPRAVAGHGNFLFTPLFATSEVVLVDISNNRVLDRSKAKDASGQVFRFNYTTPLTVAQAMDADDSGTKTTSISRSIAKNAESVMMLDDTHVIVGFSNYYQYEDVSQGTNSVVGSGVIAVMSVDNGALITKSVLVLPYKNPQFISKQDDTTAWVTCTGAWQNVGPDVTSTDAGLVKLGVSQDRRTLTIDSRLQLNIAPGEPAFVDDKIIIPVAEKNKIVLVSQSASGITDQDILEATAHPNLQFTTAVFWHDKTVFLGGVDGSLTAYRIDEGYFPFPFTAPIDIDPAADKRVGVRAQKIYFRHSVNKTALSTPQPVGFTAWVLSSVQKIYPLDFLKVFGP